MSSAREPISTFGDLPLRGELLRELDALGYEEPTPIQRDAIPPLIQGDDLLGQAATGTGKTAAFALPLLNRLAPGDRGTAPSALVLVPTRELAMQVSEAIHRYGRGLGARVLPIYGGQPIFRQLKALDAGVDVVVATPGRALDHISRGTLVLDELEVLVLDEADEMLDMGFAEDLEAIVAETPGTRQTALFSATLPKRVHHLARAYLDTPVRIRLAGGDARTGGGSLVRQTAYVVARANKPAALGRILDVEAPNATIVFCRTRIEVDQLAQTMNGRGHRAEALHGGMDQKQRDRVMQRLRGETADLLIATDVAARGLDIDHLSHVVNYDLPSAPEAYVHRIGRVGRAGREGVAVTLVEPRQHRMLKAIERRTGVKMEVEKVPTVADLRARRLEMTRAAVHETLLEDDHEHVRAVVESLSDEFDLVEIALAAVKLAHEAGGAGGEQEEELPPATLHADRGGSAGPRGGAGRHPGGPPGRRPPAAESARIYVGLGRAAGIRPGDLVGAIAGESSLSGRDIGAIEITQRFSLVEVPEAKASEVITALRGTTIKGRRASVRPDREAAK
ncbi:MAG TPA: DEAD/DEAH box helicase [Euzebyales bacterium]|nr:DEAD/DEAH box helicase [Euzebyales bacterium]